MGWFSEWLDRDDQKTFDQDLELLIARWTDRSRKQGSALTHKEIGGRLLDRAEELLDPPPPIKERP